MIEPLCQNIKLVAQTIKQIAGQLGIAPESLFTITLNTTRTHTGLAGTVSHQLYPRSVRSGLWCPSTGRRN